MAGESATAGTRAVVGQPASEPEAAGRLIGSLDLPAVRLRVELDASEVQRTSGLTTGPATGQIGPSLLLRMSAEPVVDDSRAVVVIEHLSIYGVAVAGAVGDQASCQLDPTDPATTSALAGSPTATASDVLNQIEVLRAQVEAISALLTRPAQPDPAPGPAA